MQRLKIMNTFLKNYLTKASLCLATGLLIGTTYLSTATAGSANATLTVGTTVTASCTITGNTLTFPNYSGSAVTGSATLGFTCTNGTSYTIGLGAGQASGATVTTRKMQSGANLLNYSLLQTSGGANWGNTPGTDTPAAATATGNAQTVTVFGSIPSGQTPPLGTYSDTVVATINF